MRSNLIARLRKHNEAGQHFLQEVMATPIWRRLISGVISVLIACAPWSAGLAQQASDAVAIYRAWIQDMKEVPRGPFERIRWFCNDGTVLPPKAYACRPHGGGHQHGEWSERTQELRANGYLVANVLAGSDPNDLIDEEDFYVQFAVLILEQFLISVDDGWIFREARFYRGALQVEDERAAAGELLRALLAGDDWPTHRYLALREGARLLAHGKETASLTEVRQLSATLADKDPGFKSLHNKIHGKPEAGDGW